MSPLFGKPESPGHHSSLKIWETVMGLLFGTTRRRLSQEACRITLAETHQIAV